MKLTVFNTGQWSNNALVSRQRQTGCITADRQRKMLFALSVCRCRLFLFCLCLNSFTLAQTPVQVVTKVVEKDLPYSDGQRILINAQKADVALTGWNRPMVSVRLRLVAKHPDRAVAEREVAWQQYTIQAGAGPLTLSNRFEMPKGAGKLQSQLKAIYEVSVPAKALITLTNAFGDIRLSGLSGDVTVKFEFGKLTLDAMGGKLAITSDYGDIDGNDIDATLTCKAEKADINLRGLGGRVSLQSRYGKLTLLPIATLDALKVEAARTEIVLSPYRIDAFQYDLQTTFGDLRVPTGQAGFLGSYGNQKTFDYQPAGKKPVIAIQNSYNSISLQPGSSVGAVSH